MAGMELAQLLSAPSLIAQVDQTERQVTTLIIALIVVALLLATLTAWYWHHTDPRRRAHARAEARREAMEEETARRESGSLAAQRAADEQRLLEHPYPNGSSGGIDVTSPSDDASMSADEWIRLTGPAPKNTPGNGGA